METNRELDIARFIVEKTDYNLFLTGKAGTGKTTFLRDVRRYTKKKHVVLAPTGVAAVNAGAMTIHSFFQFSPGPYVKGIAEPERKYNMKKSRLDVIRNLEMIIIDEISMVRADLLDRISDELQRIRRNYQPFGGVQMVMIGDLRQLPPVADDGDKGLLNRHYESLYFFGSNAFKNSDYYCVELKKVYRQTEQDFVDLLNRARVGELTPKDIDDLNHRYAPSFHPTTTDNYIRLVTHNDQAEIINKQELADLRSQKFSFKAIVKDDFPFDSLPTSNELELCKGAQVMFVKNDPDKRFVNGTLGIVESVNSKEINVKISGTDEVVNVEKMTWESIIFELNKNTNTIEAEVKGSFEQYPLKLAWAITIHKSQGLTFDRAIIDVSKAFSSGQAYVALSRCRSLQGVILSSKVTASNFIIDSLVDDYMKGAVQDIDVLAENIDYEYFDYERDVQSDSNANASKTEATIEVVNMNVYEALRRWRKKTSDEAGIKAFHVLDNKTMGEIANSLPETLGELKSVKGIGDVKLAQYGEDILAVVRDSRTSENTRVIPTENPKTNGKILMKRLAPANQNILDALKDWRKKVSDEKKTLPFYVLGNTTVITIANFLPETLEELNSISGIGEDKLAQYGEDILAVIRDRRTSENVRVTTIDESEEEEKISRAQKDPNAPKIPTQLAPINKNVFEALKDWRNDVRLENNITALKVFRNETLIAVANYLPETIDELRFIPRFSAEKIAMYGDEVLAVVRNSRTSENVRVTTIDESEEEEKISRAQKDPNAPKIATWQISFELYNAGKTVTEIAQERSLTESTILGHLGRYVEAGQLDIHQLVSDEVIAKVASYKRSHPEIASLKEIFEYFNETISYGEIKLALAYIERI